MNISASGVSGKQADGVELCFQGVFQRLAGLVGGTTLVPIPVLG